MPTTGSIASEAPLRRRASDFHGNGNDAGSRMLSSARTSVQLGLAIGAVALSITATATFVAAISKTEALTETVEKLEGSVGAVVEAAQALTLSITELRSDMRNQSASVAEIKAMTVQSDRAAGERDLKLAKVESLLQSQKDRLVAIENAQKSLETRILAVEIRASQQPSKREGDEK
jgi:hypothetical protein